MTLNVGANYTIKATVDGQAQLDRFNQSLREGGKAGEVSAGQIKNAYRQLPAQFTDIATSLAGGQSPFLVLLQQGGQIRDSFGSIGGALRGVASFITPFNVALGATVGVVGALAAAFIQGEAETTAFNRALATTGNYAGTTADRFDEAAQRIQEGTRASAGTARELLQAVVETGQFGPRSYEAVATAAAQLQRVTGQSSKEVIKQFQGLSKSAADWAAEANTTYNFLDVAQYRYIRQLEEAGDKEGAQRAAVDALNKSLAQRTVDLGYLESAWAKVTNAASSAWDAMLNVGRADTTGDRLGNLRKELEDRLANQASARSDNRERYQPRIDQLRAEIANLEEVVRLEGRAADAQAQRARENQAAIAAEREAEKDRKKQEEEAKRRRDAAIAQFAGLKQGFQDQLLAVRELGAAETLQAQIEAGRYSNLSKAQQEELLQLARKVDYAKSIKEFEDASAKRSDEIFRKRQQAAEKEAREQEASIERWKDIANPAEKYLKQLEQISALVQSGALTPQEGAAARDYVADQILRIDQLGKKGKDTFAELKDAVEGWGKAATDAFLDFAFTGKASFGDLVSSILKDIARMLIQTNVTAPLFKAIQGGIGGGGGAGGFFSAIAGAIGIPGFASGGDFRGGLRIVGENGPELEATGPSRIFNAQQTRQILSGSGGGTSIVVNVNAQTGQSQTEGDNESGLRDLGQRIAAAARQVILEEQRPGGLLYGAA